MNTLHTFGCSLTATEVSHWTKRLAEDLNYRINNCAVPAGDNLTQCRRFKDLVLRNKVQKGDYILWEVTYLNRLGFRLSQDHNFYLDNKDNPDVNHNFHTHLPNLIDNTYHNDYVAFNEKWYNTNWQMQNINEMLTSLLYHFTVAKNLVNNNILIWFADHIFENEIQQNNFIKYGFDPLETPSFEIAENIGSFLAEDDSNPMSDVFSFNDGEKNITLRYDLSSPLARFVAQNNQELPSIYKRYAIQNVFRLSLIHN